MGVEMNARDYARPMSLVSTDWVAARIGEIGLRLIEVDVDTAAHESGHIAGAVGWNWRTDLQRMPQRDIPTKEAWEALLERSGVENNTLVVLYGDNHNWFAAFAYWLFKLYGHADVCLMNGGRQRWIDEGRPLTTAESAPPPSRYRAQAPDLSVRALREDVAGVVQANGVALIDVRSPKEYSGELLAPEHLPQEGAQRGGHIPGASNVPWASAVREDGCFKSAGELWEIYGGEGITADRPAITYCRIGERSAHTWFVLTELLGIPNVRNYDGSWTEWGSLIGAPIER